MLIVLKNIKHPIYNYINDIIERKYNIKSNNTKDILVNGIPIKYNEEYYIIINFANIEISGLELTNKTYEIEYIIDEDIYGKILILNTLSVHDLSSKYIPKEGDCFYDEHLNIMFVKFQDVRIEYVDISNLKINLNDFVNINFEWINEELEINQMRINNQKIIYENKFINLPKIPLIVSAIESEDFINGIPFTGAKVFDIENNLVGIVSYANENNIVTVPLFLICRMIEYLNNKPLLRLNIDCNLIKINYSDENIEYGLVYKKNKKFIDTDEKSYLINKIDGYKIDNKTMIDYKEFKIPLSTYIWLFAKNKVVIHGTNIQNKHINTSDAEYIINSKYVNKLRFYYYELKLYILNNTVLSVSKLNFVNYKNRYVLELNEKIMQLLKKVIQTTNDYDYFYDYVMDNKFSKNKIIFVMNERLEIKILKNNKCISIKNNKDISIKNIETLVSTVKSKNDLKLFLSNY